MYAITKQRVHISLPYPYFLVDRGGMDGVPYVQQPIA